MNEAGNDTPHGRLIGLDDDALRAMAPEATHQHRKGGLYRDLGPAVDADTREVVRNARGTEYRGWLHVHPHAQSLLLRPIDEDDRFRPIS